MTATGTNMHTLHINETRARLTLGPVFAIIVGTIVAALITAACGSGNGGAATGDAGAGPGDAGAESGQAAEARAQVVRRPAPGTAWVIFGTDTVLAEIASIPEQRQKGLMDRDAVPDGTGMLFVFPRMEERSFWMRNTYVPLDIAFIDDSNLVAGIKQMAALDETLTDSDIATALVLEVRQGWFAERGIEEGAAVKVVFGPGLTVR